MEYGYMRGWVFLGGLLGLLLVLLLIGGLVYLIVRSLAGGGHSSPQPQVPSALAVLDDRLARGDLDVEEYRARRAALLEGYAAPPTS